MPLVGSTVRDPGNGDDHHDGAPASMYEDPYDGEREGLLLTAASHGGDNFLQSSNCGRLATECEAQGISTLIQEQDSEAAVTVQETGGSTVSRGGSNGVEEATLERDGGRVDDGGNDHRQPGSMSGASHHGAANAGAGVPQLGGWKPPDCARAATDQLVEMICKPENKVPTEVLCQRVHDAVEALGQGVLCEKSWRHQISHCGPRRWTLLTAACAAADSSLCRVLIHLRADVNGLADHKVSPLWCASGSGDVETVELLLKHRADVAAASKYGWTPLHVACYNGMRDCAGLLLDASEGAGVDCVTTQSGGYTPLAFACWAGQRSCAELLLRRGARADGAEQKDWTPLVLACQTGQVDCARLLLERGADVDKSVDLNNEETPLYVASEKGQCDVVRLLLEKRADVNKATAGGGLGETPLFVAIEKGQIECTKLLLRNSHVDVDKANAKGVTPLHEACRRNKRHIAARLLEYGADPAKRAGDGSTPVAFARDAHKKVFPDRPDLELADAMVLAIPDRAAAIERLRGMAADGPH